MVQAPAHLYDPISCLFVDLAEYLLHQTFAGVIALLNDFRISQGKSPLGFLNPTLYSAGVAGFNDITSGSNPGCGTNVSFPARSLCAHLIQTDRASLRGRVGIPSRVLALPTSESFRPSLVRCVSATYRHPLGCVSSTQRAPYDSVGPKNVYVHIQVC